MNHFNTSELNRYCISLFTAMGASEADAVQAADVLVAADLRGIDSHGVSRLKGYVGLWEAGRINMQPDIKIVREHKSVMTIDGDRGLGLVVAPKAMDMAMEAAEKYGSGWVAVQNSNHFGIAGYHAMKAAARNLIGTSMTNATPFIPPTHSKKAMLGTNPIAYAFPTNHPFELVVDLATSSVARGKLEIAKREGKTIPKGWVVNKDGQPSQDIDVLEKGGLLTPLGSLEELSSHKGYALGGLVDILSAVLSGANYGPWVPPFVSYLPLLEDRPGKGLGHFLGAMEVEGFRELEEFKSHISHWIDSFKSADRIDEKQEVYVPGEKEYLKTVEREIKGIPLNPKVENALKELALKFKIEAPQPL
ncbi:MAG: Ldh family oxidoreductase [Bacteroidia bacterium]